LKPVKAPKQSSKEREHGRPGRALLRYHPPASLPAGNTKALRSAPGRTNASGAIGENPPRRKKGLHFACAPCNRAFVAGLAGCRIRSSMGSGRGSLPWLRLIPWANARRNWTPGRARP